MYSLAPAWIAATAARASEAMPQATTGVRMRSSDRACTSRRMSRPTSTMTRSPPLARRVASPWSIPSAWVTEAPRFMAIFEAVTSSLESRPTMSSRMAWCLRKFIRFGWPPRPAMISHRRPAPAKAGRRPSAGRVDPDPQAGIDTPKGQ
jgi:hypothetical protein